MPDRPHLILLRQDLRLRDNPALWNAAQEKSPLIILYALDDITPGPWKIGNAQRWWLHHSLKSLSHQLADNGIQLVLKKGNTQTIVQNICQKYNVQSIYLNRSYEPFWINVEKNLAQSHQVFSYNSSLLIEPWELLSRQGSPFKVFTPFWNAACKSLNIPHPLPEPTITPYKRIPSDTLEDWNLLPKQPSWASEFTDWWQPGEKGAHQQLENFLPKVKDYEQQRNIPSQDGTSRLSPHLHFGEISPRQIYHSLPHHDAYIRELGWREFTHYLLYHFPSLPEKSFQERFAKFPWNNNKNILNHWQKGLTGIPIVDAGMRQLWRIGWMHNRVRMIVGSFLTKNLLIPWQAGEAWFWNTLIDANLANNAFNWQWIAGCGADAAPFFRIFNPTLQGTKFDPQGSYVKQWVPELENLPAKYIHEPWKAPQIALRTANIELGKTYPYPLVDLKESRERALECFNKIKS